MDLHRYTSCIHFKQTLECDICGIYQYCRNCSAITANKKYRLYNILIDKVLRVC